MSQAKNKSAENRQRFPQAAERLDELRAEFGDEVRMTYVDENGCAAGKKLEGYFMSADQWFRLSALIEFEKKMRKKK